MKSAYELSHVKGVSVAVILWEGREAGRIVANWSDNRTGSVCTATLNVFAGPLDFIPTTTGRAGGYGYDKLSAAIWSALNRAHKLDVDYPEHLTDRSKAGLPTLVIPNFSGAGFSEVRKWLESFGYQVISVLGC